MWAASGSLGESDAARGREEYRLSVFAEAVALIALLPESEKRNVVLASLRQMIDSGLARRGAAEKAVHPIRPYIAALM